MRSLYFVVLALLLMAISQSQQLPTPSESVKIFANDTTVGNYSEITVQVFLPNTSEPAITKVYITTDFGILIDPLNETNKGTSISSLTNESGIAKVLLYSNQSGTANITVGVLWGYNTTTVNFTEPVVTPTETVTETTLTETTPVKTTPVNTTVKTPVKTTPTETTPVTTTPPINITITVTTTETIINETVPKNTTKVITVTTTPKRAIGFEFVTAIICLLIIAYVLRKV